MEKGFDNFINLDDDSYGQMASGSLIEIKEDELVEGRIVNITKDEVHVDIGFKSIGIIPRAELIGSENYEVGQQLDVFIENIEDTNGHMILSRRRADFMKIWDDIMDMYENSKVTTVNILRRIKGGMVVDLMGIEAFLPGSQIDVRPVRDFDSWVGNDIEVKVVKVNHPNENVVVSHKVLLEEQLAEQRDEIMSNLEKGLVLEGTVKAISDFGVFVDLGGVDGLVHITDLSWGRVSHPSEVVDLDETVKVVILDYDQERKRISLGMKQLTEHPWESIGAKYEEGTKVTGKVVSLTDYGAFIEIEKGIEGLIHISEMSWTQHIKHPSQMVSMGQDVEAVVLNIDKDDKKLALGMKQLEPDPWEDLMKKYPVDSKHEGIVRNLTNFGVFVELEPGVDGLVHISDLSWTKKIRHPGEFVKKNDRLDVIVLSIDSEQRRIALGHKQVLENPWDTFENSYGVDAETEAKIERIIEKGVIVELPDGVDGFVPVSQLSFAPVKNISDYFKPGDTLPLRVVEFDKESKKIVLSVVEALRHRTAEDIEAYNKKHQVPNAEKYTLESVQQATPEEIEDFLRETSVLNSNTLAPKQEKAENSQEEEVKAEEPAEEVKEEKPKKAKATKEKESEESTNEETTENVEESVEVTEEEKPKKAKATKKKKEDDASEEKSEEE
ncbi:MAG: 30S ribosomal protein S1 [Ignavibacteriae bacterium]|nr:30S ribosomal protein S1 [Ignavibacteriota bacterium]MCB9220267.1 30S ribosomal protein S1 [Ignavibacteria bacterium]